MQHRLCVRVQSARLQSDPRKAYLQPVLCAISLHGIRIYDSKTDEEIKIPKETSTHRQSEKTEVLDTMGKRHLAAIYESGSLSHASGAKLWYLLSREKSEQNEKKLLYVSPEERETKGSYLDYAKSVDETENSITETEIAKHEDLKDDWQTVTIGKKPEEPEKPQRPEKPEKPKKPKKPRNPQEVPKTGDAANAAGYLLLLAGASAGLVFSTGMLRKRRKTNR